MTDNLKVPPERLHHLCASETLGFETTDEIEPLLGAIGQDDAIDALRFGVALKEPGYNIFVLGRPGSGRSTFTRQTLETTAREEPAPPDWCYVFDFRNARRPAALSLPAGRGPELDNAMAELISDLREAIPGALETVADQRRAIIEERGNAAADVMDQMRDALRDDPHVTLVGTPEAMTVVAARGGEPLTSGAYNALPVSARKEIDEHVRAAARHVFEAQHRVHHMERKAREDVTTLHREVTEKLVAHHMTSLAERFDGVDTVTEYLQQVQEDMADHVDQFLSVEAPEALARLLETSTGDFFTRYAINPLVTNDTEAGAPVILESNPNLRNLFGHVEGQIRFGVMVTDFTRIVPGAAQRANGGYLVLNAEEVLTRPMVWPALKRAIRTGELRPADPASEFGLPTAQLLEPSPIPASFTVVLIGEPHTYYLLQALDSEFDGFFKVKVDFAPTVERSPEMETLYARLVARVCRERELTSFNAEAVARLIGESSRQAGDQKKLSTRFRPLLDLVTESAHLAGGDGAVTAEAVDRAVKARERRTGRPHEELLERIERGALHFDPTGEAVGQVHGIALIAAGDRWFGRPIRVMASAYLGSGGVIQIEREAQLSGPIHNKGFLVVSGYLGRQFARTRPLILSASLSFDQLYEEVEGDSASAAELYALMSAIGEIPIAQGMAVTGAINQDGVILPVGGVTQKIEGYFAACQRVGGDAPPGVLLPRKNLDNLVLRREVEDAVRADRFHLYAIDRIEEGWEILTGLPFGQRREDGSYPKDTVHGRVECRLEAWADEWTRRQSWQATRSSEG